MIRGYQQSTTRVADRPLAHMSSVHPAMTDYCVHTLLRVRSHLTTHQTIGLTPSATQTKRTSVSLTTMLTLKSMIVKFENLEQSRLTVFLVRVRHS